MPLYKFQCQQCGSTSSEYFKMVDGPSPFPHEDCGTFERVWTVPATRTPFRAHFNHSVGQWISSDAEFRRALKVASDEKSERTGIETSYVPVESAEQAGVTEDGMEATHRRHRELGWTEAKKKIVI